MALATAQLIRFQVAKVMSTLDGLISAIATHHFDSHSVFQYIKSFLASQSPSSFVLALVDEKTPSTAEIWQAKIALIGFTLQSFSASSIPEVLMVLRTHLLSLASSALISLPAAWPAWSCLVANAFRVSPPWSELADFIQQLGSSADESHRRMWIELVYSLLTGPLDNQAVASMVQPALPAIASSLIQHSDLMVRATSFAVLALLLPHFPKSTQKEFILSFPSVLAVRFHSFELSIDPSSLPADLSANRCTLAVDRVFEGLSAATLASDASKTLLPPFLQFAKQMIASPVWPSQARASALEYLLDYSTALCGQVRKSSATTAEFLRLAAQLAADPNALRLELHQSPATASAIEEPWLLFTSSLETFARLVETIGTKKTATHVRALIQEFGFPSAESPQPWTARVVALALLTQHSSLIQDDEAQLHGFVSMVFQLASDAHPSVRLAALACLSSLSTDLDGWIQENMAAQVFQTLFAASKDSCPRVVACAAATLSSFCENVSSGGLLPYMTSSLNMIESLLQHSELTVREEAIEALAALARLAAQYLVQVLPQLLAKLLEVIQTYTEPAMQTFRLRSLECATLLLVHVPAAPDMLQQGAQALIDLMLPLTAALSQPECSLPLKLQAYIWSSWAQLVRQYPSACSARLGDLLSAYLGVLGSVAQRQQHESASAAATGAVILDEMTKSWIQTGFNSNGTPASSRARLRLILLQDTSDDRQLFVQLCMAAAPLSTSAFSSSSSSDLSESSDGLAQMLTSLSEVMDAFPTAAPATLMPLSQIMVQLLQRKGNASEELGETVSFVLKSIVVCHQGRALGDAECAGMFQALFDSFIEFSLKELEVDPALAGFFLNSLYETVFKNQTNFSSLIVLVPSETSISHLQSLLQLMTNAHSVTAASSKSSRTVDDNDDDGKDTAASYAEDLIASSSHLYLGLARSRTDLYQSFGSVQVNELLALVNVPHLSVQRAVFYLLASLPSVLLYHIQSALPQFVELFLQAAQNEDPLIRQAGVYGLGELAMHTPSTEFASFVPVVLQCLDVQINGEERETYPLVTENAISSLLKVVVYQAEHVSSDRPSLVFAILSSLPLRSDADENQVAVNNLVVALERQDSDVLGNMFMNLPKLLEIIFGHLCDAERVATPSGQAALERATVAFKTLPNQVMLQQALMFLPPHLQSATQLLRQ